MKIGQTITRSSGPQRGDFSVDVEDIRSKPGAWDRESSSAGFNEGKIRSSSKRIDDSPHIPPFNHSYTTSRSERG